MTQSATAPSALKARLWSGRILTILVSLFLVVDAISHMLKPQPVVTAFADLGYSIAIAPALGIVELFCVALYLIPRTAVIGAILLTGYLGGAVASNVRVGHAPFEDSFPIIVGVLAWLGLGLRSSRVRAILLESR